MRERAQIVQLQEQDALAVWDGTLRWPIRERLGISAFGANVYSALESGQRVIEEHDHAGSGGQEELYVVLSGRVAFTVTGEEFEAPAGTLIFVQPQARRRAVALEAGTSVLVVGAPRGAPYSAPSWPAEAEMWRYRELFQARKYDEAVAFLEHVLERFPGNPGIVEEIARCKRARGVSRGLRLRE